MIWEWLDAIQCWLADLMNTKWITPNIDDIGFPELPSVTVSLDGDIVWSTKEDLDIDLSDDDNDGVVDYVVKNVSSLSLVNTLSDSVIEKNQTIRVDTALENSQKLINDDVSNVELFVTQIDDLDSEKTYLSTDKDWEKIRSQYLNISGSPKLKD